MTQPSFDLVDQPWIPVLGDDGVREVSLREALVNAHTYAGLDMTEPLEAVAVMRQVLLPVVLDACGVPRTDSEWAERWGAGRLNADRINAYLGLHREKFDLFDPVTPFAQVAGLATAKAETKSVSVLIAPEPTGNNVPLFGVRTEANPRHLDAARAARVLLACHCFDTAGIKSGAAGDPAVKSGKTTGNPTGPVGQLGVCIPVAPNLAQTLILNTPVMPQGHRVADVPQWRQPTHTPAWTTRSAAGVMDLLSFQARRVRLLPDAPPDGVNVARTVSGGDAPATVSRVVLCAGDRLNPIPEYEPHTQFRQIDKPEAGSPARRPVRFQPGKAPWRGLDALLASAQTGEGVQTSTLLARIPGLCQDGYLPRDFPLLVLTVGVVYGNQMAVVDDVISDAIPLPVAALIVDSEVHGFLLEVADQAERLRKAANDLEDTVRRSSGGDPIPWDKSQKLGDVLITRLERIVHRLLIGLQHSPDLVDKAEEGWLSAARASALAVGEMALDAAPPCSFLGRPGSNAKYPDRASAAEARFRANLNKILPLREGNDSKGETA